MSKKWTSKTTNPNRMKGRIQQLHLHQQHLQPICGFGQHLTHPTLRRHYRQKTRLLLVNRIWPLSGGNKNSSNSSGKERGGVSNGKDSSQSTSSNAMPSSTNNSLTTIDPVVREASKVLQRTSFVSWWSQVILTTISSIILLFAQGITGNIPTTLRWYSPRFFLSGTGLLVSGLSILWTWGNGSRLSRILILPAKRMTRIKAGTMIRKAVSVGVVLNLIGLLLNLLAAFKIIGALAVKVLTLSPASSYGIMMAAGAGAGTLAEATLQPLDILIVQANTNALLSHFISLTCSLYLTRTLTKLSPPQTVIDDNDAIQK